MLKTVIVDDEPSVLEGLKIFVDWQKEGYEIVGEASDGLSAYPVIREKHPDLVICDIRMPGLTGLELLEKNQMQYVSDAKVPDAERLQRFLLCTESHAARRYRLPHETPGFRRVVG